MKMWLEKWIQLRDSDHQSDVNINAGREGEIPERGQARRGGEDVPAGGRATLRFGKWAAPAFRGR